jgi:hypothetical protein
MQVMMDGRLRAPVSIDNLLERRKPIINVLANLIFRKTISLLKPTFQLVAFAVDRSEIVVSKFAPFFLHFALELFPVTFNSVPVHGLSPHFTAPPAVFIAESFGDRC